MSTNADRRVHGNNTPRQYLPESPCFRCVRPLGFGKTRAWFFIAEGCAIFTCYVDVVGLGQTVTSACFRYARSLMPMVLLRTPPTNETDSRIVSGIVLAAVPGSQNPRRDTSKYHYLVPVSVVYHFYFFFAHFFFTASGQAVATGFVPSSVLAFNVYRA